MVEETIFQHFIFREFILPFLLIFAIVFAILEKTKILGDDKKQTNAIVAFVIGLIFVGVAYPKDVVNNMILFLTVSLVVAFVALLLWGFLMGEDAKIIPGDAKWIKWVVAIVVIVAVAIAFLWASGIDIRVFDFMFRNSGSKAFWTNATFIVVVVIAIAIVMRKAKD
jgi:hypothetical protein